MKRVIIGVLVLLLTACTARVYNETSESYQQKGFGYEQMMRGHIGLLPVTSAQELRGFQRPLANDLKQVSDSLGKGNIKMLSSKETLNRINKAGLTDAYNKAITQFQTTSVLNSSFLSKLYKAVETRYIFVVHLGKLAQSEHLSYDPIMGGLSNKRKKSVTASAQLWDAKTAEVVWEGYTQASSQSSATLVRLSDNPSKYTRQMAEGIIKKLYGLDN